MVVKTILNSVPDMLNIGILVLLVSEVEFIIGDVYMECIGGNVVWGECTRVLWNIISMYNLMY
jgi:hypothetical protein